MYRFLICITILLLLLHPAYNQMVCIPGSTILDDSPYCDVGNYCNENGECVPLEKHPRWGNSCPGYEGTDAEYCGLALQCIHHKCYQCEENSRQFSSDLMCLNNKWQFSKSLNILDNYDYYLTRDPVSVLLICSMAIFVLNTLVSIFVDLLYIRKNRKQEQRFTKEMEKDHEFMKFYHEKLEKERKKKRKKVKKTRKALRNGLDDSDDETNSSSDESTSSNSGSSSEEEDDSSGEEDNYKQVNVKMTPTSKRMYSSLPTSSPYPSRPNNIHSINNYDEDEY
ncbi:hypothetical protein ABK040_016697 [Willaertia magna]